MLVAIGHYNTAGTRQLFVSDDVNGNWINILRPTSAFFSMLTMAVSYDHPGGNPTLSFTLNASGNIDRIVVFEVEDNCMTAVGSIANAATSDPCPLVGTLGLDVPAETLILAAGSTEGGSATVGANYTSLFNTANFVVQSRETATPLNGEIPTINPDIVRRAYGICLALSPPGGGGGGGDTGYPTRIRERPCQS